MKYQIYMYTFQVFQLFFTCGCVFAASMPIYIYGGHRCLWLVKHLLISWGVQELNLVFHLYGFHLCLLRSLDSLILTIIMWEKGFLMIMRSQHPCKLWIPSLQSYMWPCLLHPPHCHLVQGTPGMCVYVNMFFWISWS